MSSRRWLNLSIVVLISGLMIVLAGAALAQSQDPPDPDKAQATSALSEQAAQRTLEGWTPSAEPVARVQSVDAQGTVTLTTEGFEGVFPSAGWDVSVGNWGASSCRARTGSKSAWIEGGTTPTPPPCGSGYGNDEFYWMVYGPFDLSDATSATLKFSYQLTSELDFDFLFWGSAITPTFFGTEVSGNSNGWVNQSFDLSNRAGQPSVSIAFVWISDGSITRTEGAYIDDVVLTQYIGSPPVYLPAVMRNYCASGAFTENVSSLQPDMTQINADDAWQQCVQGDPSIVVAVIDTGADLDHPDLVANLVAGYDYIDNDAVPEDGNGHGTNVAGIVGAAINGQGVVGVAPRTRLLPVRVLNNSGSGTTSSVANGITYAADRAQVLNLSLSTVFDISTIRSVIEYAVNTKGRLVVAAAGNCGDPATYTFNGCSSLDQPNYPAAYSASYPNVMAVAAVNGSDQQASFSNQGSYVSIAAPGVDIYSTFLNGGYFAESGTSQASPHVAGLAALIWARNPGYTAAQVRSAIETTAVDLGSAGRDIQFGWGRINVLTAVGLSSLPAEMASAAPALEPLPAPADRRNADIAPGRVLIKFQPAVSAADVQDALDKFSGVSVAGEIGALGIRVLSVPAGQEWTLVDQLRALPNVEFAEPDYIVQLYP
ncbi:MAG TPA: S8 family serine peptidase [Anaerolineae bacterium]